MPDFFEFEEPCQKDWQAFCQGKLRKHPWFKKWMLHSKVRMASKVFDCDECYIPITPGDCYLEEVYAYKGKIEVKRYHWPECPHDPWDEDEMSKDDDNFDDIPQTVSFHAPLRKAA